MLSEPLIVTAATQLRIDIENTNWTSLRQQETHYMSGKHPKAQIATHGPDDVDAEIWNPRTLHC